jgi:hypothetical protein
VKQFRNYCDLTKIARCGFSWRKTTKSVYRSPDFLQRGTGSGKRCAAFFAESRMQFGGPAKIHRKSGFGVHRLRSCFGGQGTQCAKRSSQELLCPRKFHPILSAKRWGLVHLSPNLSPNLVFECSRSGMPSLVFGWFFLSFALFMDLLLMIAALHCGGS